MRMKNIIAFLSVMLAVCFSGCSKENIPAGEEVSSGEGIELSISLNGEFGMDSRSALLSSEPMHHIEHMYAYVFAADGDELTVDNAKCIYEEKLPWTATAEGATVFRCRLKPDKFDYDTPDKEYLVMVVATDNNKDTYTFPWSDESGSDDIHLGMTGKKLSDVKMALATSAKPEQMAYTEVFAGFHKFTTKEQLVNVKLSRRVAGVICYLTDIPATISVGADEVYQIVGVQLHCNGGLNREGVLTPNLTPDASGNENFLDLSADAKNESTTLLAETDLHALGAETGSDGATLYIPAINQEGVLKTLPNTALMGAYMLPVKEGAQFSIRLVGAKKTAEGGLDLDNKKVFDATDTDGYYLVKQQGSAEETYPVNADYVYNIGYKPYTADTDYDQPLSLKGKDFTVVPSDWTAVPDINVDFPTVAIGIILDTGKTINHRYDCISNTDNMNVTLLRPDFTADNGYTWRIEVAYTKNHDEDADINRSTWIDFNGNDLTGSGEETISFTVKEYVNDRKLDEGYNYNPDEDYREATLTLSVYKDGKLIYQTKSYIRQWNALIVKSYDEDGKELSVHRAFRRLDLGDSFDSDGKVIDGNQTYQWKFKTEYLTYPNYIFKSASDNTGDNGKHNLDNINKYQDYWSGSAMNAGSSISGWYLPARIELHAFIDQMYGLRTAFISEDKNVIWWSATAVGGNTTQSYTSDYRIATDSKFDKWWTMTGDRNNPAKDDFQKDRDNYYRVRQATQNIQPVKNE